MPALFVNGAVGDVSPRPRGWAGVATRGKRARRRRARPPGPRRARGPATAPRGRRRSAWPCRRPALSRAQLPRGVDPASVTCSASRAALPAERRSASPSRSGGTAWVTIPGELETRLGLEIKAGGCGRASATSSSPGSPTTTSGTSSTPASYRRPSYIACGSLYGERGGEIVRDAALAALRRLGPAQGPR